jgi:hypothetical protein
MYQSSTDTMEARRAHSSPKLLVILLILLGLIPLRLFLVKFAESDFLTLALSVNDDSFYYLLPAWHFTTHGYFTFDGLNKMYGFQPLYLLLLTSLSAVLPSIEAVFRVGLCVNAALHVGTGVLVGLAANAVLPGPSITVRYIASLLGGAVYLLGHNLFLANVTLKENPLASFLYVLSILCLLRRLSQPDARRTLADVGLGSLLGCLILARLLPSSLLAVGVMVIVVAACMSRRSTLVVCVAMLAPLLVWGGYAMIAFGHLLPTSFLVKSEGGIMGAVQYWRSIALSEMAGLLTGYGGSVWRFLCDHGSRLGLLRGVFFATGLGALIVCFAFRAWWSRGRTVVVLLAVASVFGLFTIPILLYSRQEEWLYFKWYLFDISAIFAIVCAAAMGFLGQRGAMWLERRGRKRSRAAAFAAAFLVGFVCIGAAAAEIRMFNDVKPLSRWEYSPSEWMHVMTRSMQWFQSVVQLEEGEYVGAWSAGMLGLLLPGKVINLDGLANDDIVEHLGRGGSLAEYVSRNRIRYIIDVSPPAYWEALGVSAQVLMMEEFKNPKFQAYYVLRLP